MSEEAISEEIISEETGGAGEVIFLLIGRAVRYANRCCHGIKSCMGLVSKWIRILNFRSWKSESGKNGASL